MAFRRNNILRNGRPQASGTVLQDAAIDEVLEALVGRIGWNAPFDRGSAPLRRGRGIAIGLKASISPTTSVAVVNVSADGSVYLYKSTVDMGQGADTAFAQPGLQVTFTPTSKVSMTAALARDYRLFFSRKWRWMETPVFVVYQIEGLLGSISLYPPSPLFTSVQTLFERSVVAGEPLS